MIYIVPDYTEDQKMAFFGQSGVGIVLGAHLLSNYVVKITQCHTSIHKQAKSLSRAYIIPTGATH